MVFPNNPHDKSLGMLSVGLLGRNGQVSPIDLIFPFFKGRFQYIQEFRAYSVTHGYPLVPIALGMTLLSWACSIPPRDVGYSQCKLVKVSRSSDTTVNFKVSSMLGLWESW